MGPARDAFRFGFIHKCRTLTADEWRRGGQLADRLYTWAEADSEISRLDIAHRRFHLYASLLLEAGPRPELPLTDPAHLLRAFLDGFPYSIKDAQWWVANRPEVLAHELDKPMTSMDQMRRVEHLFPRSTDLDEYRAWQDLWARVTGVTESERRLGNRGGRLH